MSCFTKLLKLSHVPRWAIIDTTKNQSVAEHSFRVMAIVKQLSNDMDFDIAEALQIALIHDMDEADTGDIPTPVKEKFGTGIQWPNTIEHNVVKVADYLEAVIFIDRYGVNAARVRAGIYDSMRKFVGDRFHADKGKMMQAAHCIIHAGGQYE